jgi:hypothetical protein
MDDKAVYIGFEFILLFALLVAGGALLLYPPWPANLLSLFPLAGAALVGMVITDIHLCDDVPRAGWPLA